MSQALNSFTSNVCGASRRIKSFDLGLSFVIEAERLDWQSSLEKKAFRIVHQEGRVE